MRTDKKSGKEYIIPSLITLAAVFLLILTKQALFPVILSLALSYVLYPVIKFFEVRGIKRIYAVTGLYLVSGIVIFTAIYFLFQFIPFEFSNFQKSWNIYAQKIFLSLKDLNARLTSIFPFLPEFNVNTKLNSILQSLPQILLGVVPALTLFFIVPFITFFILLGGPEIVDYVLDHIPSKHVEVILHILSRIDTSLGNYMRGILTEAFVIFTISLVGLVMLQLNYAPIIAIIIGISAIIPYIGAFVGALISSIVAYFQSGAIYVLKILVFFAGVRFADDWFIQPFVMKRAVELNPAIVVFSLMAGYEIGGIWGMIFSIPVTCVLKELLQIAMELQETEFMWKPKPHPTRISIPYT